jgi:hypothetical protein
VPHDVIPEARRWDVAYEQLRELGVHFASHEAPARWKCQDCKRYVKIYDEIMKPFKSKEFKKAAKK